MQTVRFSFAETDIFSFIGEAGSVTPGELVEFLGVEDFRADVWLRRQTSAGYLYAGADGRYATSCPWPRAWV